MAALNIISAKTWTDAIESLSKNLGHDDYLLLPLVILGSAYVINRGSALPKKDPLAYVWYERPQVVAGATVEVKKRSRDIAVLIRENQADLVVFWGSQSGTAEGFAHRFAREAQQRYKLSAVVADLGDYDAESIASISGTALAVFIMSTYGEGDPSDNAQDFISWTVSASNINLGHLKFAGFGCGNSNYRYYNKTIDVTTETLLKLGATQLVLTGKGNEATRTTEEDFIDWKEEVFTALATQRGFVEVEAAYEPQVEVHEGECIPPSDLQLGNPLHKATSKIRSANIDVVSVPVISRTELARYSEPSRSCIEVKVDLTPHAQVKYKTGDHIAVWPENSTEEVDGLIQILELEDKRSKPIRITAILDHDETKVPGSTTIEALFSHYLEIGGPVSRETVLAVARMALSETIRKGLQEIGKDRDTYSTFLKSDYLTFFRLLSLGSKMDTSASWKHMPLSFIIDTLPAMQPRLYSISSSSIISPRQATLTVSVKPTLINGKPDIAIPGITSSLLAKTSASEVPAATQSNLHVQIRGSTFKLPITASTPLIMVAAGTGIAPFRAFVQERARLASIGKKIGDMILLFGCQNESDYLYSDELNELCSGPLAEQLELSPAFSRAGSKKVYVQDQVHRQREALLRLLCDEDAALYICGAATMAREVRNTLSEAVKDQFSWSDVQFEGWLDERKKSKRWFEDVWS